MSSGTEALDPSAPYDGAPPQRSWGGDQGAATPRFAEANGIELEGPLCPDRGSRPH